MKCQRGHWGDALDSPTLCYRTRAAEHSYRQTFQFSGSPMIVGSHKHREWFPKPGLETWTWISIYIQELLSVNPTAEIQWVHWMRKNFQLGALFEPVPDQSHDWTGVSRYEKVSVHVCSCIFASIWSEWDVGSAIIKVYLFIYSLLPFSSTLG